MSDLGRGELNYYSKLSKDFFFLTIKAGYREEDGHKQLLIPFIFVAKLRRLEFAAASKHFTLLIAHSVLHRLLQT